MRGILVSEQDVDASGVRLDHRCLEKVQIVMVVEELDPLLATEFCRLVLDDREKIHRSLGQRPVIQVLESGAHGVCVFLVTLIGMIAILSSPPTSGKASTRGHSA